VVINLCVFQNKISLRICMQHILKHICIQDFFSECRWWNWSNLVTEGTNICLGVLNSGDCMSSDYYPLCAS
jgi:hypothetical protein